MRYNTVKKHAILIAAMTLATTNTLAEEKPSYQSKASAELGLVITDGNTETQNINAKYELEQEWIKWKNKFKLEAYNSSEDESTSAEKYLLSDQLDYLIDDNDYLFGRLSYEDDRFSGFDYQATISFGYGHRFLDNDLHTLDLEIGPGYRVSKISMTATTDSDTKEEGIVRAGLDYNLKLSETATFQEEFTVEAGSDVTITKSVTSLKAQISGKLAMKISLTVKNTSEVPDGKEETDTETAVTLVYSF